MDKRKKFLFKISQQTDKKRVRFDLATALPAITLPP